MKRSVWGQKHVWVFDSILVLLKSVLIFHRWGFYGTDSIHEKLDEKSYFSKTKCYKRWRDTRSRKRQNRGRAFATFIKRTEESWRKMKNFLLRETLYGTYFWLTRDMDGSLLELKLEGGASVTPVTAPAFLVGANRAKPRTFEWFECSVTQQPFKHEALNPFKPSIAIWFKSESYMVSSFSFFIVILVKKKEKKVKENSYTIKNMLYYKPVNMYMNYEYT